MSDTNIYPATLTMARTRSEDPALDRPAGRTNRPTGRTNRSGGLTNRPGGRIRKLGRCCGRIAAAGCAIALLGGTATARADGTRSPWTGDPLDWPVVPVMLLDVDSPAGPAPISHGQQPFPLERDTDETPDQTNSTQLNQLFQFETTPDICSAGEAYVTANFVYLKYAGSTKSYRYQVRGQYGLTDQIAVGAYIPAVSVKTVGTDAGLGDIGVYGQYKMDRIVNPQIIDLTLQADLILPTGDATQMRDTGRFGFRPMALAYKDFGVQGPGRLGMYGLFGFTISSHPDVRFGLAGTYQFHDVVGVLEFYDQAGDRQGRPLVQLTPGILYRGFHPFEVGIGFPIGVNSGTPDWGINFKLTYVFR